MGRPGAELGDHVRVDGAEAQLARAGSFAPFTVVVEHPAQLGAREVRVEHQAGALAKEALLAVFFQRAAHICGAPVLPDDGVAHRLQIGLFPQHGGLALIGDADRRNGTRICLQINLGLSKRGSQGLDHRSPYVVGVVLDPAGLRIDLPELLSRAADDAQLLVDDEHGRAGGSLIDRNDVFHGSSFLSSRKSPTASATWARSTSIEIR